MLHPNISMYPERRKIMNTFKFDPAPWLPAHDRDVLEKCRNIRREDMEYTNENGFSVKVVIDPLLHMVIDCFHRIYLSDVNDTPLTMIFPNQWPGAYSAIANMLNTYNVSCRNVNAFAMDEWADQDGNVAPLTYGASLGYSFRTHFYGNIREDLRPPVENWHVFTNDNKADGVYSRQIEDCGGADIIYSATGWPGHIAFIDPDVPEFQADSFEEFLKLGSRVTTQHHMTLLENALFAPMGAAGDVWAVPPRAVTIGPRDVVSARERLVMHNIANPGGDSWQRMISRIELYGPIDRSCPSSIVRLGKGTCYVSEVIARPFGTWPCGLENKDL